MNPIKPILILALALTDTLASGQTEGNSVPTVVEDPKVKAVPKPSKRDVPPQAAPVKKPEPAPAPAPVVREPVQVAVPDSRKTEDQRGYESATQKRLDTAIQNIETLKASFEGLPADKRDAFLNLLRTAEGNRSAARTKFKQMKYISPSNWQSIKRGIDQAFEDLEGSILRANEFLEQSAAKE